MPETFADYTKLTIPERLTLIGEIWDSVVAAGEPIGLTDAQRQELDRRRRACEEGLSELIPWEEVKRQSRRV